MYSVMWSEHCSYKSSKVHLRQFGEKAPKMPTQLLVGIGENAGVVDIGDGLGRHLQGRVAQPPVATSSRTRARPPASAASCATSSSMGARPVAVMDPLRFGPADAADTARVLPGVVAGIGGYGNCLGLPNIGGEVVFDAVVRRQPAGQRAVRRRDAPRATSSSRTPPAPGNLVVLFGAKTGGDGIGGVSVLASETFDDGGADASGRASRSATRSWRRCSSSAASSCSPPTLVVGIQDLGGAGLSCATSELASARRRRHARLARPGAAARRRRCVPRRS